MLPKVNVDVKYTNCASRRDRSCYVFIPAFDNAVAALASIIKLHFIVSLRALCGEKLESKNRRYRFRSNRYLGISFGKSSSEMTGQ